MYGLLKPRSFLRNLIFVPGSKNKKSFFKSHQYYAKEQNIATTIHAIL